MSLSGRHILVTAGPTHEPIDPVRVIANRSSGRQGFANAEAAAREGARLTLVSGPVSLPTPPGVDRIDVDTVLEKPRAMVCRVIQEAASVSIQFPGNRMRAPKQLGPALEFISKASRFPVSALPGGLSDNSKLTLARRLVRDGLLKIVDGPGGRTNPAANRLPEIFPIELGTD